MHRADRNPRIADDRQPFAPAMRGYYRCGAAKVFDRLQGPDGWVSGLADALVAEQHRDGRWVNDSALQKEDDPVIATSLALSALARAMASQARGDAD